MIYLLTILVSLAPAEIRDGIYETVNGEIITYSDIDDYQKQLRGRLLFEPSLFPEGDKQIDETLKDRKKVIEKLVEERLLDSEAKKMGINITEEQINREVEAKGGAKHLTSLLAPQKITLREYQAYVRKNLARREVIGFHIRPKVKVSEDDVLDFYSSLNKGGGSGQGFEYDLSHILFEFKNKKERDEAQASAQEALKALGAGSSFTTLHARYNPKAKDDSFGVYRSGETLPVIENSIARLKAGETSQVVESPMGFHIFRLNSKKIANNPDFEKRKAQIHQALIAKGFKEQLEYWLSQQRRDASIVVNGEKK